MAKLLLDLYFFWLGPQVSLKAIDEQKSLDVVLKSKKLESFAFDEVFDDELEQAEAKEEIKVDLDELIESPDVNTVSSSPSINIISSSPNIPDKFQLSSIKATSSSRAPSLSITTDEHGSTCVETSALEEKEVDLVLSNASSAHSQENGAVTLDPLPPKISETATISSQSNSAASNHFPMSDLLSPPPNGTEVKRSRGRPKKKKRPVGRPRGRPKKIFSDDGSTASIQLPITDSAPLLSEPRSSDLSHENAAQISNSKPQGDVPNLPETLGCKVARSSSSPGKGPRSRPHPFKEDEEEDIERYSEESLNQDPDFSMGDSSFELEDESFEMLIDDWNDNPKELKANGLIGDQEGEEEEVDVCERRSRSRSVKTYFSVGDEEEGNCNATDMGENGIEDADSTKEKDFLSHSSSSSSIETETRKKEREQKCKSKPKRSVKVVIFLMM